MNCPVCSCEWDAQPTRCVCGYDFANADSRDAIAALQIARRRASKRTAIGALIAGSTLITFAIVALFPGAVIGLPLMVTIQVLFGLGTVASGMKLGIRAQRQLLRAKAMQRQLPAARLVIR